MIGYNPDMHIGPEIARSLNAINLEFYSRFGESFSATRNNIWPGWERCVSSMRSLGDGLSLLDIGCGNLRFERFLERKHPGLVGRTVAVDIPGTRDARQHAGGTPGDGGRIGSEIAEAAAGPPARSQVVDDFVPRDIVERLILKMEGTPKVTLGDLGAFDALACFGFMHHVPGSVLRAVTLDEMCTALVPEGIAMISFWCFMDESGLRTAAETSNALAKKELGVGELERGDAILGWQGRPGAWRYCHSFSDEEIDALADGISSKLRVVDDFRSDGRNGKLNRYLVLQRT